MTEEIRPICLYVETCLDRKEGTRDCAKCEHHLNYWTEVMIRDMEKNINRLEQENNAYKQSEQEATEIIKELKEYSQRMENQRENYYKEYKKYRSALDTIQRMVLWAWEQGKYLDGGLYDDLTNEFAKINEVLK